MNAGQYNNLKEEIALLGRIIHAAEHNLRITFTGEDAPVASRIQENLKLTQEGSLLIAYHKGHQAFHSLTPSFDCPYDLGNPQRGAWMEGFSDAMDKNNE